MWIWDKDKKVFVDKDNPLMTLNISQMKGYMKDHNDTTIQVPKGTVIDNSAKKDSDFKTCVGHDTPILILKKKIKVYAGAASKTKNIPKGALTLDLADRYGNGLYGFGVELPKALTPKRILLEWPDMGKPTLYKWEWDELVKFLVQEETVKEHGIYVACQEGHGRTGTCISILAHFLNEWPNGDIPKILRKKYCPKAIETTSQIEYFEDVTGRKTTEKASSFTSYSGGQYGYNKAEVCTKTIKSVVEVDHVHTCIASQVNHTEHWCSACKWDWKIENGHLWEKPALSNQKVDDKTWKDGGEVTVLVVEKPKEKYESDEKCFAWISIHDIDEWYPADKTTCELVHVCDDAKGHLFTHKCMDCNATWKNWKDSSEEGVKRCRATGGVNSDHKCVCLLEQDHLYAQWGSHTCHICSKMFHDDETEMREGSD